MPSGYILLVDDEPDIRSLVQEILEDEGYQVAVAENGEGAREQLRLHRPDVMLLDIWMPDVDGITILREIYEDDSEAKFPVIMMSGHANIESAVEATRLGAYDFLEKPLTMAKLLLTVEHAMNSHKLNKENQGLKKQLYDTDDPIGKSEITNKIRNNIETIAAYDTSVLFTGEPGCGKSKYARLLHRLSKRNNAPFIDVGVASLNKGNLIEELFGSEENGKIKYGLIEQTDQGTLYLDDVAKLDQFVQARIFHLLEYGEIYRVSGAKSVKVNTRIIAATRYDLKALVDSEKFRRDLYFKLIVTPFNIPPLREHREDIPDLLNYYRDRFVQQNKLAYRGFTMAAINRLRNYEWRGNLFEIKNFVQRLLINSGDERIEVEEVDQVLSKFQSAQDERTQIVHNPLFELPLKEAREQFEKSYLSYRLIQVKGSVGKVAKFAQVERTHLYRKIRALEIDVKALVKRKK